jgi:hypothetical protein
VFRHYLLAKKSLICNTIFQWLRSRSYKRGRPYIFMAYIAMTHYYYNQAYIYQYFYRKPIQELNLLFSRDFSRSMNCFVYKMHYTKTLIRLGISMTCTPMSRYSYYHYSHVSLILRPKLLHVDTPTTLNPLTAANFFFEFYSENLTQHCLIAIKKIVFIRFFIFCF